LALKVRGLNAWPVAQTLYQDKVLRIWQALPIIDDFSATMEPSVVRCKDKNMDVVTGDGFLRLLEVQLPGGKRMPIQAFLSAHDVDGVKLG
jgi:methionyl-tRNA formyltransferase